jgi:hypothetical protein
MSRSTNLMGLVGLFKGVRDGGRVSPLLASMALMSVQPAGGNLFIER